MASLMLLGEVTDHYGNPLPLVPVQVLIDSSIVAALDSDNAGGFVWEGELEAGQEALVTARCVPGGQWHAVEARRRVVVSDGMRLEVSLTVCGDSFQISGELRDENNRPYTGGRVWTYTDETTTGEDGTFSLRGTLWPITKSEVLRASRGSSAPLLTTALTLQLNVDQVEQQEVSGVIIWLPAIDREFTMLVTDPDERPIEGAVVTRGVVPQGLSTNASGTLQIAVSSTANSLLVQAPGYADDYVGIPDAGVEQVHVTLHPKQAWRGRVVFSSGSPAVGATVRVREGRASQHSVLLTADHEGEFEFKAARQANTYYLYAEAGIESGQAVFSKYDKDAHLREYAAEIYLRPRETLRGKVLDETGQPVADARLRVYGEVYGFVENPSGRTQSDGTFEILVPVAGGYRVNAWQKGHQRSEVIVGLSDDLTIVIPRKGLASGVVVSEAGSAVTSFEATVSVRSGDGWSEGGSWLQFTSETGRFVLECGASVGVECRVLVRTGDGRTGEVLHTTEHEPSYGAVVRLLGG